MNFRKKLLPVLLTFCLLCGCSERKEAPSAREENLAPVAPQTAAPLAKPTPSPLSEQELTQRVLVRYAEEEKNYRAEGSDDLLLSYRCRTPEVELPGLDKQEGLINTALASLAERFRNGAEGAEDSGLEALLSTVAYHYAQWAADDPTMDFPSYAYERDASVVRGDGTVISILFSDYIYSGGVHGGTNWSAVSFDTETGEMLTLNDLAEDAEALKTICITEIQNRCEQMKDGLFEDYAEHMEELYDDGLWYLNDSGLVFIANQYHLAPYAAGTLSFTIRYKALKGVLRDRYLLPERSEVQGGLEAFRESEVTLGSAEPKLALKLDDYGEKIVITGNNTVYNIRLFTVGYEESSGEFYQMQEQGYLSALHDGEYFTVQSSIPDVIPDLQLSWRLPDGSSQRYLLSQSGEDGSILMVEPNTLGRIYPGEVTSLPLFWDLDGDGEDDILQLTLDGVWKLRVNEAEIATVFEGEMPKLYAADVDEDECCELFLEGGSTVFCYRYDSELKPVDFILKGEAVNWLNATVLDADSTGLHLSCNIPLADGKLPAQAYFRDGINGSLSLAYGSRWDFFTHGALTLSKELAYLREDGSSGKLPSGAVIYPESMDDAFLFFTTEQGERGNCALSDLQ